MLGTMLAGIAMVVGMVAVAYALVDVPKPNEFAQAQTSTVYYADGTTAMGEFAEVDRTIIDPTTLPDYVGNAVVASEDRSFYTNSGVDPKGIIRALWNNLKGGATQGASTLTQQYVKNYYVDTTGSYAGKFEQAIIALKIDREQSKETILGNYLNTIYFGRGAYGIEAASQAYFGHPASQLTIAESALLAGIIPAPSAWDPAIDEEQAKIRFERVLDYMAQDGYITAQQRQEATFPETIAPASNEIYSGPQGFLLQMVRDELRDHGMTDRQIDTGGYHIVTTINKDDQNAIVTTATNLPGDHDPNLHVAMVSIDPTTGGILALYGGEDYLTNQVNTVTNAVAQAGSTYKPFALIAALENGATLSNGYMGTSPMQIDGTEFENFGDVSYGWVSMVEATANSINTPYLQLNRDVGPSKTNSVALRAGYPEDTLGMNTYVQNVLGSASPHTLDIARAYATIASGGTRHDTHIVAQVTDSQNTVIYSPNVAGEKVFDDGVMADTTYALTQVVQRGSGDTAQRLGRPIAAKTGSSSDNKSAQFVGFTPQIVTAVTLYQSGPNGEEESITPFDGYEQITGSTVPADLFTNYMEVALQNLPIEEFPARTPGSYTPGHLNGKDLAQPPARVVESQEPVETATPESTQAPTPVASQAPAEPEPVETEPALEEKSPGDGTGSGEGSGDDTEDGANQPPPEDSHTQGN